MYTHDYEDIFLQNKMKKTLLVNYGVEHISYSKEIKDKTKKTCLQKYNKNPKYDTPS